MNPLRSSELRGNWATLLLPINADDEIDYPRLEEEIDTLIASSVDGIYSNGTAGEFYNQTEAEFDRISALLADRCEKAGMPFQIGVSHMSPRISLERLRRAIALEPSAVQVILPDWMSVTDEEAIHFLQRMADAAGPIGLVLYNPPHAKRVLPPEAYATLQRAVPSVIGLKVMDGDEAWYAAMRESAAGLSLFIPGHHLASGLQHGASGSYSNVACLHPGGAQAWCELAQRDRGKALDIESRLCQFMTSHISQLMWKCGYCNAAVDKLLAAIGEWSQVGTRLRWPYRWIAESEAARLRPIARAMIPELLTGGR